MWMMTLKKCLMRNVLLLNEIDQVQEIKILDFMLHIEEMKILVEVQ